MLSFTSQLRFFAFLILGGISVACSQPTAESVGDSGPVVCAPAENIAVCYFRSGIIQGDSPTIPIYEALRDALNLPIEELRDKRYVGRMGEPNNRTFVEIFNDYFTGSARLENGNIIDARSDGFLEALKQPEARPPLKKWVDGLGEAIRTGEYWDWDGFHTN